ncbi:MAG: AraC family transcriptional regulator [Bacteroidota bacterium]
MQMKPEYEIITDSPERSFIVKTVSRKSRPLLSQAWHYHPEIEICFTKEGWGKRFVGNQISDYQVGDLVLFGSNLPHGFTTDVKSSQVVIQLHEDFLGQDFINKPELAHVRLLFKRAQRGLHFGAAAKQKVKKVIKRLLRQDHLSQLISLFDLLNILASTKDVHPICSKEYSLNLDATYLNRLKIVYDYIVQNFQKEISVKVAAEQINLTESAFYKFIKKNTKKTFTEIINEYRVNHASKLLMTTDMTIAEVCYSCGYNNVSYFNRKFKAIIGVTPSEFKLKREDRA